MGAFGRLVQLARPTYGLGWFLTPLALLTAYLILARFDTSTEISPSHDATLNACFAMGGLSALFFLNVAIFGRQKMKVWQRICSAIPFSVFGFLPVFLLSDQIATLVEQHIDFPPESTVTYPALLLIDRAYQTHGKGQSWHIQIMPIWSDLEVTESDYQFMLDHRRPGDLGRNADEISSEG